MKRPALSSIAACALLALPGCAARIGDFTIVSTKNYNDQLSYRMVSRETGTDRKWFFGWPDMKNAVDDAIDNVPGGVYLTNAVIEFTTGPFNRGFRVTGDVYAPANASEVREGESLYRIVRRESGVYMTNGRDSSLVSAR